MRCRDRITSWFWLSTTGKGSKCTVSARWQSFKDCSTRTAGSCWLVIGRVWNNSDAQCCNSQTRVTCNKTEKHKTLSSDTKKGHYKHHKQRKNQTKRVKYITAKTEVLFLIQQMGKLYTFCQCRWWMRKLLVIPLRSYSKLLILRKRFLIVIGFHILFLHMSLFSVTVELLLHLAI